MCRTPSRKRRRAAGRPAAYNRTDAYVSTVLGWIAAYDQEPANGGEAPEAAGTLVDVHGIVVDASLAAGLEALLAAAGADGLVLSGSGHRNYDDQVAMRRAHCGTSTYAVFEMPSDACSPPTARPGESQHELGLAVDFTCADALVSRCAQQLGAPWHEGRRFPMT